MFQYAISERHFSDLPCHASDKFHACFEIWGQFSIVPTVNIGQISQFVATNYIFYALKKKKKMDQIRD